MRASPPASPSPVTNPLRAYARDLDRLTGATTLGPADALWLELALALYRLGSLDPDARQDYTSALQSPARADAPDPVRSSDSIQPRSTDVPALVAALAKTGDDAARRNALSVLRGIVEAMENRHAFHLAFATLSAARRALPDLPPLLEGRIMAQQGRVVRQIGDLETAADLYAMVLEFGNLHDEPELLVRGHVGAALIAETHGNFPAARAEYHRALEHAAAEPRLAASAHHGLMVGASKAGDLPTAFHHAWAAFEGVAGDPVRRVDMLINLAELARKAGEARVALGTFRKALEHVELSRLRLPALSGAAHAAAALGERPTVESLAEEAEREAAVSGMPYEIAKLWRELAEAFLVIDDSRRAAEYARRAAELAEAHGFHEHSIKAATIAEAVSKRDVRRSVDGRDATSRDILRRLDALFDAGREVIVG